MKYSGIDLHSNNSVVTVMDEQDRIVAEKRLPNDPRRIIEFLTPWREQLAGVVVESTFNWYWLGDGLQEAGYTVKLANTTAIKKYEGLKHSGDEADACHLAHLLRPWAFFRPVRYYRRTNALYAIWRASGCSSFVAAPPTSSRWRTLPPVRTVRG
jgi:transposase